MKLKTNKRVNIKQEIASHFCKEEIFILGKPEHGWVDITIGEFFDRASYLTDIPIKCLSAFISAFQNNLPVSINFDAEGWEYIIVVDHYNAHIISDSCNEGFIYKSIEVKKIDLAKELISDIEENFDGWIDWECWKPLEDNDKIQRSDTLKRLIEELKGRLQ